MGANFDEMLGFYSRFISPGNVCFDVGANIGDRTAAFLALGARVVAVEPQAECAAALSRRFGPESGLVVVQKALGRRPGEAEMLVSPNTTISSLSPGWVETVSRTGRFAGERWDGRRLVDVTTLDRLMADHGVPSFIKIDVEGFEAEVVRGLSRPVPALSFEFTPEYLEAARACLERLDELGGPRFNLTLHESLVLLLDAWLPADEMWRVLDGLRTVDTFGDVYALFPPGNGNGEGNDKDASGGRGE